MRRILLIDVIAAPFIDERAPVRRSARPQPDELERRVSS
jgi:hypothetical protein